jgi:hypothetical protein
LVWSGQRGCAIDGGLRSRREPARCSSSILHEYCGETA